MEPREDTSPGEISLRAIVLRVKANSADTPRSKIIIQFIIEMFTISCERMVLGSKIEEVDTIMANPHRAGHTIRTEVDTS